MKSKWARLGVLIATLSLVLTRSTLAVGDVFVKMNGGVDQFGGGGPSTPFKTIWFALSQANTGDVIKVQGGLTSQDYYTKANGETFPLPLRHDVDIIDDETSDARWPRIGGDIANSSVKGVFECIANSTTGSIQAVSIEKLILAGENTATKDAPSAVYVESSGGNVADVTVSNCLIERSEMNDSNAIDKPAIRGIGGYSPNAQTSSLKLTVTGSPIRASTAGGVVVDVGPDATASETQRGLIDLVVTDCSFLLDGSQGAEAAIDYVLEGYTGASTPLFVTGSATITGNVIDSRSCSGSGSRFTSGIRWGGVVKYGGVVKMEHDMIVVMNNDVRGCVSSCMSVVSEMDGTAVETTDVNVQSFYVHNNKFRDCLGSGIVLDWGDGVHGTYLRVIARGCMIVDNGQHGVDLRDATEITSPGGQFHMINCTVAGNAGYGVKNWSSVGTAEPGQMDSVENCIIYDNDLGGAYGWVPGDSTTIFDHNDYEGLSVSWGCVNLDQTRPNLKVDPGFVNSSAGDYHLATGSCCIDNGENRPSGGAGVGLTVDIDGEARVQDSDHADCQAAAIPKIDIGADEVPDPCSS